MLQVNQRGKLIPWLQLMLLKSFLAQTEKHLPWLLPTKNPYCLVAIEGKSLVATVKVKPVNLRGTCWTMTLPNWIENSINQTQRAIGIKFLYQALNNEKDRANSWVIKCSSNDQNQISIAKELGFQVLQLNTNFIKSSNNEKISDCILDSDLNLNMVWKELDQNNIGLLLQLQQQGQSTQLKQILDLQSVDLLYQKQKGSGVLIDINNPSNIILGIFKSSDYKGHSQLKISRGIAWDERINQLLPKILDKFFMRNKNIIIQIPKDDNNMKSLLIENDYKIDDEEILLGKTIWRRQLNKRMRPNSNSLESMLESLQPQNRPLPTPFSR